MLRLNGSRLLRLVDDVAGAMMKSKIVLESLQALRRLLDGTAIWNLTLAAADMATVVGKTSGNKELGTGFVPAMVTAQPDNSSSGAGEQAY